VFEPVISWLALPLSASVVHSIEPWAAWHARLMVLSWGLLVPLGVLIARFYKVTPGQDWPRVIDNKFWWHSHRLLQWTGLVLMTAGAWFVWGRAMGATTAAKIHALIGWSLLLAGWLQVIGSFARGSTGGPLDEKSNSLRGDHYDMTPRRLVFERVHKSLGWTAVLGSVIAIVLGLFLADAPRWMLFLMIGWWLTLACAFTWLQRRGRCIDTYQAIWGPDLSHPGNRLKPIGVGVKRLQKN
jgi:hypothetical protein